MPCGLLAGTDNTVLIGADEAARLLEIGVAAGDGIEFIVHAMPARARGITWSRIGEILGASPQAAQQRYGAIVEQAEAKP